MDELTAYDYIHMSVGDLHRHPNFSQDALDMVMTFLRFKTTALELMKEEING